MIFLTGYAIIICIKVHEKIFVIVFQLKGVVYTDKDIFINAQNDNANNYRSALSEIAAGRKRSCWIWYVFPILKEEELMVDFYSRYFAFESLDDAKAYAADSLLMERLAEITEAILVHDRPIAEIMGSAIDVDKLHACMTLFQAIAPENNCFERVLNKYYNGKPRRSTLKLIEQI